jgi:hypothetical protein
MLPDIEIVGLVSPTYLALSPHSKHGRVMARLDYPKLTAWLVTLIMAAAFAYIVYSSRQAARGSYQALKPQADGYVQKLDQAIRQTQKDISGR